MRSPQPVRRLCPNGGEQLREGQCLAHGHKSSKNAGFELGFPSQPPSPFMMELGHWLYLVSKKFHHLKSRFSIEMGTALRELGSIPKGLVATL